MPSKASGTHSCVVRGAKSPYIVYVSVPGLPLIRRSLLASLLPTFQSNDCQAADWQHHRTRCTPAPPRGLSVAPHKVMGVTIPCNADRARGARAFEAKVIEPSHAIHTHGIPCPLFRQVGFPLVIFRHIPDDPSTMARDPGLDNQLAAHLLTHPNTGNPEQK